MQNRKFANNTEIFCFNNFFENKKKRGIDKTDEHKGKNLNTISFIPNISVKNFVNIIKKGGAD